MASPEALSILAPVSRLLDSQAGDAGPRFFPALLFVTAVAVALSVPTEVDQWDLGYVWNGYRWFFSDPAVLHDQQIGCYVSNLIGASLLGGFGRLSPFAFALFIAAVATPCALALRKRLRSVLREPMLSTMVFIGLATSTYVGLPFCHRALPFYSGFSALFGLVLLLTLLAAVCDERPALYFWAGALFPALVLTRLNNALLILLTLVLPFDSLMRRRGFEWRRWILAGVRFLTGAVAGAAALAVVVASLGHGKLVADGLRRLTGDQDTYGGWANHLYFHRATLLDPKFLLWSLEFAAVTLAVFLLLRLRWPRFLERHSVSVAFALAFVPPFFNVVILHVRLPALWWWSFIMLGVVSLLRRGGPASFQVLVLGALLLVLLLPLGAISPAYTLLSKCFVLVIPVSFVIVEQLGAEKVRSIARPAVLALALSTFAAFVVFPPLVRAWELWQYPDAGMVTGGSGGVPVRIFARPADQVAEAVSELRTLHASHPGRLVAWEHLPQLHALTGIAPLPHTGGWIGLVNPPERLAALLRTYRSEVGLVFQQKHQFFPIDPAMVTPGYTYSVPFLDGFLPADRRPPANARHPAYDAFVELLADFELLVDRPTYRIYGRKPHR